MDKVSDESYVEQYAREHRLGKYAEKEEVNEDGKNTRSEGQAAQSESGGGE